MPFREDVFGSGHSFERIIRPAFLPFVGRWEAWRPKRYKDGVRTKETPAGPIGSDVWSIGYGHAEDGDNAPFVIPEDMELTMERGLEILQADLMTKCNFIHVRVKAPLTTYQFEALTSLCFQYGNGRLDKTGIFPLLNDENYIDAACLMLDLNTNTKGVMLRGLKLRRAAEVAHFITQINK